RPHVCTPPAASAENVSPPWTATGAGLLVVSPVPSRPLPLYPQQYAAASLLSPQTCRLPVTRLVKCIAPDTAARVAPCAVVPVPSCPRSLSPQHHASAAGLKSKAQVKRAPAVVARNRMPPATATGVGLLVVDPSPS